MSDQTVYVVTSGAYSDYHIVAIFSTEELAQAFCDRMRGGYLDGGRIEEYRLDASVQTGGGRRFPYWVDMDRTGERASAAIRGDDAVDPPAPLHVARWNAGGSSLRGMVWACDEAHALKIASERRMQLLASGAWEPDE